MITKTLASLTLAAALSTVPVTAKTDLRVGTYNLRRARLDEASAENNWARRESRLIASLMACDFDLCGLQEVDSEEQESIPRALSAAGKEYGSFFFSPYEDDGVGTKAHGLIWKKDRFEVLEIHHFWLSDPPSVKQVNDLGGNLKGKFIRGGFCAIVKDLKNKGKEYFMMVTHAPLNKDQHAENAHIFIEMEQKYNPEGRPSFFVGDFNARETYDCSTLYRTWWTDSYHFFDKTPSRREGPFYTFNGWKKPLDPASEQRIDFVYFRGKGLKPLRYVCDDRLYDGLYASDHFPVWVDFRVK